MGEEFTVMLLCFLKESSANDGITWTNIEYAEDLHSINVDLRYYLQTPQPDNMEIPLIILESSQVAGQLHCCCL